MPTRMPTAGTAGLVLAQLVAVALVYAAALVIAAGAFLVLLVLDGGGDTAPSTAGVLLYGVTFVLLAVGATQCAVRVVRSLTQRCSRRGPAARAADRSR